MNARYIDSTDTFKLTLNGYCGMPIPIVDEGDREDCRSAAARKIRRLRSQGFPVVTLESGEAWEVQEPEDCVLVPDQCGILRLSPVKVRVFECFVCGYDIPEGECCSCQNCAFCESSDCSGYCQEEEDSFGSPSEWGFVKSS